MKERSGQVDEGGVQSGTWLLTMLPTQEGKERAEATKTTTAQESHQRRESLEAEAATSLQRIRPKRRTWKTTAAT